MVELIDFAIDDHGMAGVIPSLKSYYVVTFIGKIVSYLALTLVAPLCSNDSGKLRPRFWTGH